MLHRRVNEIKRDLICEVEGTQCSERCGRAVAHANVYVIYRTYARQQPPSFRPSAQMVRSEALGRESRMEGMERECVRWPVGLVRVGPNGGGWRTTADVDSGATGSDARRRGPGRRSRVSCQYV